MIAVIGSCFSSGRDGAGRVVSDWERCVIVARGEDGVMSYSNSTLTAQPRGDRAFTVV